MIRSFENRCFILYRICIENCRLKLSLLSCMICLYTLFLNEITNLFLGGYKLNICIIDDEHLALEYLDFLFNKIEGVQVTGKYNSLGI